MKRARFIFFLTFVYVLQSACYAQKSGLNLFSWDLELYEGSYGIFLDRFIDAAKLDEIRWQSSIAKKTDQIAIANSYLQHPRAFESLPIDLQTRLTEGLGPKPRVQIVLNPGSGSLLDRDGNPLTSSRPGIISRTSPSIVDGSTLPSLQSPSIITSASNGASLQSRASGLLIKAEQVKHLDAAIENDAATQYRARLLENWRRYVFEFPEEAIGYVQFSKLSPSSKERVFRTSRDSKKLLLVRENDPFFKRIEMTWDNGTLELKLKNSELFSDRKAYVRFTQDVCEALQCSKMLSSPRQSARAGIHYHFSISQGHDKAQIEEVMKLYKLRNGLEHVANGEYLILGNHLNSYAKPLHGKGNVKQVDDFHYEIREPFSGPDQITKELEELFAFTSDETPHSLLDAKDKLKSQIAELLETRLEDFKKLDTAHYPVLESDQALENFDAHRMPTRANWQQMKSDLAATFKKNPKVLIEIQSIEGKAVVWSDQTWNSVLSQIYDPDKSFPALRILESQYPFSASEWNKVSAALVKNFEKSETGMFVSFLAMHPQWDPVFFAACAESMKKLGPKSVNSQTVILALQNQTEWPEFFWHDLVALGATDEAFARKIQLQVTHHLHHAFKLSSEGKLPSDYERLLRKLSQESKFKSFYTDSPNSWLHTPETSHGSGCDPLMLLKNL